MDVILQGIFCGVRDKVLTVTYELVIQDAWDVFHENAGTVERKYIMIFKKKYVVIHISNSIQKLK